MRTLSLWAVLAALALPGWSAQALSLAEAFSGQALPLSLTVKELTPEWRRFSLEEKPAASEMEMQFAMLRMLGIGSPTYYTSGQTVEIAGETFLVAYSRPQQPLDPRIFTEEMPPMPKPVTPDTALTLSLLNLRTAGILIDIRPFNLRDEMAQNEKIMEDAQRRARQTESMNNLRQVTTAILMFMQDHDEKFPLMATAQELKEAVTDYVGADNIFLSPVTKEPYLPNASLSNIYLGDVKYPSELALVFEASPDEDGYRWVAFCDGHVERVNAQQWGGIKKRSNIP